MAPWPGPGQRAGPGHRRVRSDRNHRCWDRPGPAHPPSASCDYVGSRPGTGRRPPKRTLVPRAGFPAVLARLSASPIVSARGSLSGDATDSSADQAHHLVQVSRCVLLGLASVGVLGPCGLTSSASTTQRTSPDAAEATTTAMASAARVSGGQTSVSGGQTSMDAAPTRFTIRPDDYHVPYAGTAGDGRRFS